VATLTGKENRSDNPVIPDGKTVDIYFKSAVRFARASLAGLFGRPVWPDSKGGLSRAEDPMTGGRLARSLRYRPRG
jgi:hypothetical protein